MSEFLNLIPTEKLNEILSDAEKDNLEAVQMLVRGELARRSFALSNGVYDANDGTPQPIEHPEDEQWVVRSGN